MTDKSSRTSNSAASAILQKLEKRPIVDPILWLLGIGVQILIVTLTADLQMLVLLLLSMVFLDILATRLQAHRSFLRVVPLLAIIIVAYSVWSYGPTNDALSYVMIFFLRITPLYSSIWMFFALVSPYDLQLSLERARIPYFLFGPLVVGMAMVDELKSWMGLSAALTRRGLSETSGSSQAPSALAVAPVIGKNALTLALNSAAGLAEVTLLLASSSSLNGVTRFVRRKYMFADAVFIVWHLSLLAWLLLAIL